MKPHVRNSEKRKRRRARVLEVRRGKKRRAAERLALINTTIEVLTSKPKMMAFDIETGRAFAKAMNFGLPGGMRPWRLSKPDGFINMQNFPRVPTADEVDALERLWAGTFLELKTIQG